MTKNELLTLVAAIVSTLNECNGCPESQLYLVCKMDMDKYGTVREVLVNANLVTIKGHYVTLTAKGRETAQQIEKVLAKK